MFHPPFLRVTVCVALLAAITFVFAGEAFADNSAAGVKVARLRAGLQQELDGYLKDRSAQEHVSALSLSVSLGKNQPTIDVVSGTTKYRAGSRITPASLFQIGSNTKAFTAVAILQLEARGRLSIDAPIGNYLPQYSAYRKLTLRRLLSMTGGLESYDNTQQWERSFANDPTSYVSADTLIRLVYPHIKFPPGSKYYYSNTGYLIAQKVVDARSETKSYAREVARIIASVGLRDTFYTSNYYPAAVARRVVAGYYENNDAGFGKYIGKDMSGYTLSWAQGAGSIVSTPKDLEHWARELYRGTSLLPPKQEQELLGLISVKTAKAIAAPTLSDSAGFGLGVAERADAKLGTFWFYQGETLGFRAAHLYFPNSDVVVCIFANSRPTEAKSNLQSLFAKTYARIAANKNSPSE